MRREWDPEDLIACSTLIDSDGALLGNKAGATRLGFVALLKFFEQEARLPRHGGEVSRAAVDYLADQVKVDSSLFGEYTWSGRTIEYHRAQIRAALGFREPTVADEDSLAVWLAEEVCPVELSEDRLREALWARCRAERMEPPAPGRGERILGAARSAFERQFTARISGRLSDPAIERLEQVVLEESRLVQIGGGGL